MQYFTDNIGEYGMNAFEQLAKLQSLDELHEKATDMFQLLRGAVIDRKSIEDAYASLDKLQPRAVFQLGTEHLIDGSWLLTYALPNEERMPGQMMEYHLGEKPVSFVVMPVDRNLSTHIYVSGQRALPQPFQDVFDYRDQLEARHLDRIHPKMPCMSLGAAALGLYAMHTINSAFVAQAKPNPESDTSARETIK
jgi:hypothetical protein